MRSVLHNDVLLSPTTTTTTGRVTNAVHDTADALRETSATVVAYFRCGARQTRFGALQFGASVFLSSANVYTVVVVQRAETAVRWFGFFMLSTFRHIPHRVSETR